MPVGGGMHAAIRPRSARALAPAPAPARALMKAGLYIAAAVVVAAGFCCRGNCLCSWPCCHSHCLYSCLSWPFSSSWRLLLSLLRCLHCSPGWCLCVHWFVGWRAMAWHTSFSMQRNHSFLPLPSFGRPPASVVPHPIRAPWARAGQAFAAKTCMGASSLRG